MNAAEAQAKMTAAINANPEAVIAAAEKFAPHVTAVVADTRKANGPLSGVAAVACRYALKGDDNAATIANMIRFAESL